MNTAPRLNCPVILTIAGSDCSSGAGIQADMKAAMALGVYALTAVTCVVSEIPGHVSQIQEISTDIVVDQVKLLMETFPVGAVKTGMLYSPEIVSGVAEVLRQYKVPLVIDPVMIASSGDSLMKNEAVLSVEEHLLPLAALVTPNMDETAALWQKNPQTLEDNRTAARELAEQYGTAFLVKGGHLHGTGDRTDILALPGGDTHEWTGPWYEGVSTHGTGCTYSAAIAAGIAAGLHLPDAVEQAHRLVAEAIGSHFRWTAPRQVDALNTGF